MLGFYLLVSLLFLIGTMIELAIVLIVKRKLDLERKEFSCSTNALSLTIKSPEMKVRRRSLRTKVDPVDGKCQHFNKERNVGSERRYIGEKKTGLWTVSSATDKIDFLSLVLFLFSYFIFNCVYWINYLTG